MMKININNLYFTNLYAIDYYIESKKVGYHEVKKVIVYMDIFGHLFDISNGRSYKTLQKMVGYDEIGTFFIDKTHLIPLSKVMQFETDKVSKKKILNKLYLKNKSSQSNNISK